MLNIAQLFMNSFFPIFSGVIKQPMIDENHVKIRLAMSG